MLLSCRAAPGVLRKIVSSAASRPYLRISNTTLLPLSASHRQLLSPRHFSSPSWRYQAASAPAEVESPDAPGAAGEITRFQELADKGIIDPSIISTLTNRMNIHTMTDVQRLTLNHCLDGSDVIGQAKTGTGKTLAFLMPIVQRILNDRSFDRRARARPSDIRALIISPTRELAEQIAVEANKVVSSSGVIVQTAVGGTDKREHLRQMQRKGCHILVGTPGRVIDLLSDPSTGVSLENIQTFVMDEADRLLDIGFAPDIQQIQSFMPDRSQHQRQTLMFSATVPKSVVNLVRQTLREDFKFVRTIDPDEAPVHDRIPQHVVFAKGLQNQIPTILEIAKTAIDANKADPAKNPKFKAIVFFGSTAEVGLFYEAFNRLREPLSTDRSPFSAHPLAPCSLFQMQGKLSQQQRTRESQGFRFAESGILFSSDVSARGMDFPNVTHVIQIGLPRNADDYVHRLGRTGRAGKSGEGWLILQEDERRELPQRMREAGINLQESPLPTADLDMTTGGQIPAHVARMLQMVELGVKAIPYGLKADTYRAMLGVLPQQNSNRSKQSIIDKMNEMAQYGWGMQRPPSLSRRLVERLGMSSCRGITYEEEGDFGRDSRRDGRNDRRAPRGRGDTYDPRDPFGQGISSGVGAFGGRDSGRGRSDGFGDRRSGSSGDRRGGFGNGRQAFNDQPHQQNWDFGNSGSGFGR